VQVAEAHPECLVRQLNPAFIYHFAILIQNAQLSPAIAEI
jgi:hypothetical protein